jgi:hypothetical protein
MNQLNYLRSISIFMITLILTLPFYSAQSLAAVDIVRNAGRNGVEGFADARGDLWGLDVRVTGEEVTPERVKINNFPFQNCTKRDNGHDCSYNFLFRTAIQEGDYPVNVEVKNALGAVVATATDTLVLDGSAPQISNYSIVQTGSTIRAGFNAVDKPQNCVGIGKIEFLHQNRVVQTIAGINGSCAAQPFNVSIPISVASSGQQTLVIRATDRLGHSSTFQRSFFYDAVAPDIKRDTFKLGAFHRFVPDGIIRVPFSIEIHDDSAVIDATLSSSELGISNKRGDCKLTSSGPRAHIHTCTWLERDINAKSSFSITITATDRAYTQQVTIPVQLTSDTTPPAINSFGVEHPFDSIHRAKAGFNTFVAKFTEDQSGMNASQVVADFSGVNNLGARSATECTPFGSAWTCIWRDVAVEKSGTVFLLADTSDVVGNRANVQGAEAAVVLDTEVPVIVNSSVLLVALAGREGTPRDVFTGGDALQLTFDLENGTDIRVIGANVSDVVSDGGFVPAQCATRAGKLTCLISTPRIHSGYDPDAQISILARDHAGNEARLKVDFEILGTGSVQNPNFWEKKTVKCSPEGLDVNTLKLAPQRMFCTIPFERKVPGTTLAATQLVRCTGNDQILNRVFLMNNFKGSTSPALVFEFVPFEAENANLTYSCDLLLTSQRSDAIIQQPEKEQVNVSIRLVETAFDRDIRTIEDRIEEEVDRVESGFFGTIDKLNKIFTWIKIICNALQAIIMIVQAINIVMDIIDIIRVLPPGEAAATGECFGGVGAEAGLGKLGDVIQGLCQFLTCNPVNVGSGFSDNPISKWQANVLKWYNAIQSGALGSSMAGDTGAKVGGAVQSIIPAKTLYDNLIISSVGLCLPGAIYNLEKLRQIECRYIYCLKNEVKSGIATIEACRELRDYQECKYVWGEVFQQIPLASAIDDIANLLKTMLKDPVGIVRQILVLACSIGCPTSGFLAGACTTNVLIWHLVDLVLLVKGALNTVETIKEDYCSQVT